jgi:hypothetical protein
MAHHLLLRNNQPTGEQTIEERILTLFGDLET